MTTSTISTLSALALPVVAQLNAPEGGSAAVWWLVGLACVATASNQVFALWRTATGRFAEREGGPRNPTAQECEGRHYALATVLERMDREHAIRTEELRKEIKTDIGAVYQRIEDKFTGLGERMVNMSTAMGEVRGEMKRLANGRERS
jgi:hypothetical protein